MFRIVYVRNFIQRYIEIIYPTAYTMLNVGTGTYVSVRTLVIFLLRLRFR
jgi:hypothetical protein